MSKSTMFIKFKDTRSRDLVADKLKTGDERQLGGGAISSAFSVLKSRTAL